MAYYYPAKIQAYNIALKRFEHWTLESHDARKKINDLKQSGLYRSISLNGVYYD